MASTADETKDRRDAASIAEEARELFGEWEAEEEAGYTGEVSWGDLKRDLDAEKLCTQSARPPSRLPRPCGAL